MKWIELTKDTPPLNATVFTWSKTGMRVCIYKKCLTWSGYKNKFCNILSKVGLWDDDVTHWLPLPEPPNENNTNPYPTKTPTHEPTTTP